MSRRVVSKIGKATVLAMLLSLQSGCQDLNSLVTGEKFLLAPKGTARVEVEVEVVVHEAFYASLQNVDREAFEDAVKDLVLSVADVGLRFYPVASEAYGRGDDRPDRHMIVELGALTLAIDEETIEEDGHPMFVVANVERVSCNVNARVEKRRSNGPALVVGTGEARGKTRVQADSGEFPGQAKFEIRADAVGHEGLVVSEQNLLDAFQDGAVDALRAVVKAVDRDLALEITPY